MPNEYYVRRQRIQISALSFEHVKNFDSVFSLLGFFASPHTISACVTKISSFQKVVGKFRLRNHPERTHQFTEVKHGLIFGLETLRLPLNKFLPLPLNEWSLLLNLLSVSCDITVSFVAFNRDILLLLFRDERFTYIILCASNVCQGIQGGT